jgi:hypothetical protein
MDAKALQAEIERHFPRANREIASALLQAAHTTRLPLAAACALLEKESGFRHVFGHDPTRSIPVAWRGQRVTRAKYLVYRAARKRGLGMQGVGPTQLTWFAFQDQADSLGGCWRLYPNLVVGFRHLRELTSTLGRERGAAAYNGIGDAAEAYGRDYVQKRAVWADRLAKLD